MKWNDSAIMQYDVRDKNPEPGWDGFPALQLRCSVYRLVHGFLHIKVACIICKYMYMHIYIYRSFWLDTCLVWSVLAWDWRVTTWLPAVERGGELLPFHRKGVGQGRLRQKKQVSWGLTIPSLWNQQHKHLDDLELWRWLNPSLSTWNHAYCIPRDSYTPYTHHKLRDTPLPVA